MTIYSSILGIALLLTLIGFLWLVITGFKRSVVWGLLVFLFSPLTAIIFALTNWFDARKPFLIYMLSLLLAIGTGVYMYTEVGSANMQKLSSRLQSGEISFDEAVRLMEKAMLQTGPVDLFKDEMQNSGVDPAAAQPAALASAAEPAVQSSAGDEPAREADVPPAEEVPAVEAPSEQVATQEEATQDTQTPAPPAAPAYPTPDRIEPDPLAVRKEPRPQDTVQISIDSAGRYIGRYLIIDMKNGSQQRGLLARADEKRLLINRKLYGGSMEYPVYHSQIKTIRVLKAGTEPKT